MADPAFSDGFEGATLDAYWTPTQINGTVGTSTTRFKTGQKSLQMARTTGGQLTTSIKHTFSAPQYGTLSVWFYDTAAGGFYSSFAAGNTAQGYIASIGVQDWNSSQYYYGIFGGGGGVAPGIGRSLGWHRFTLTITPTNQVIQFDSQTVFSGANSAGFDTVTFWTTGPGGSGAYYYDDFTFTPMTSPSPIEITSLKSNGLLTWTNLPELSSSLFSVEWAPSANGGWRSSWESLAGLMPTGLVTTVEVPMLFRVKATPSPLMPFPAGQQMTLLVSNAVGAVSTQHIAVLNYARPIASTNVFAVLEQDNLQPGIMLMRSTGTAAYRYSPVSGGEVLEFMLGPVGTTWTNYNYEGSGYDNRTAIEAIENVTVPAGTFPCYKFHKQAIGVPDSDRYEWVSPGIGFIKWIDYWVEYTQNPPITYQLQSVGPRN